MEKLINELKEKIIKTLNLTDISYDDIDENDQLIGGKLGIDSIDILELVMMIEADYFVKIDNKEIGQKVFSTLRTLSEYILEFSKKL